MSTSEIVRDFIAFKLENEGYHHSSGMLRQCHHPTSPMRTMRILGQEFATAYYARFAEMTAPIFISEETIEYDFKSVAKKTVEERIDWGRIIGVTVFASLLSIKAMEHQKPDLVVNIVTWTIDILQSPRCASWIAENSGWNGFVEYYKLPHLRGTNGHRDDESNISWGKLATAGVVTLAGAAAVMNFMKK